MNFNDKLTIDLNSLDDVFCLADIEKKLPPNIPVFLNKNRNEIINETAKKAKKVFDF